MATLFEYMFKFFKISFDFGDISISFFDIFMIGTMLRVVMWLITFDWKVFDNSQFGEKAENYVGKKNYIVDKKTGEILNP